MPTDAALPDESPACMPDTAARRRGGAGVSKGVGGTQKANAAQRSAAFREDPTGRASASVPAATPAPPRRLDHAANTHAFDIRRATTVHIAAWP